MTTVKLSEFVTLEIGDDGYASIRETPAIARAGPSTLSRACCLTRDETHALYEALHARYTSVSVPFDPITPEERKRKEGQQVRFEPNEVSGDTIIFPDEEDKP